MNKFCKGLREQVMKIINHEKKEMIPLANKKNKLYRNQKVCYICKEEFKTDDKKVKDHCHFTAKYR